MRSILAGLRKLVVPWGVSTGPRVVIQTDDPIMAYLNLSAAVMWYWNDNTAFMWAVEQSGSPNYGQLHLYSTDDTTGILAQWIDITHDLTSGLTQMDVGQNNVESVNFYPTRFNVSAAGDAFGGVDISSGTKLELSAGGDMGIAAGGDVSVASTGGDMEVAAAGALTLDAGTQLNVKTSQAWVITEMSTTPCTVDLALAFAAQAALAGTLVNVTTVTANASWQVHAVFDMDETVAGTAIARGYLYVDGVVQSGIALFECSVVADRACVAQTWSGTFATAGVHTFELKADKSAAAGTIFARAIHSKLSLILAESGG